MIFLRSSFYIGTGFILSGEGEGDGEFLSRSLILLQGLYSNLEYIILTYKLITRDILP
jgi:hypothetical protein